MTIAWIGACRLCTVVAVAVSSVGVRFAAAQPLPRGWIGDECAACEPAPLIVNVGTRIRYACVSRLAGETVRNPAWDPSPVTSTQLSQGCDNCWNPCSDLNCIIGGELSETDSGEVSSTATYAIELSAEVNATLAAAIGIEATAEFTNGQTNSTSVTRTFTMTCEATAPRCRRIEMTLDVYSAPRVAWRPIEHVWYASLCPGGLTSCSSYRALNSCGTVGHARIDGAKGYRGECAARDVKCAPDAPPCKCEPVGPPGG